MYHLKQTRHAIPQKKFYISNGVCASYAEAGVRIDV